MRDIRSLAEQWHLGACKPATLIRALYSAKNNLPSVRHQSSASGVKMLGLGDVTVDPPGRRNPPRCSPTATVHGQDFDTVALFVSFPSR